jgi:hypothetical protein
VALLLYFIRSISQSEPDPEAGFSGGSVEESSPFSGTILSPLHSLGNAVEEEREGERRYKENRVSLSGSGPVDR